MFLLRAGRRDLPRYATDGPQKERATRGVFTGTHRPGDKTYPPPVPLCLFPEKGLDEAA